MYMSINIYVYIHISGSRAQVHRAVRGAGGAHVRTPYASWLRLRPYVPTVAHIVGNPLCPTVGVKVRPQLDRQ